MGRYTNVRGSQQGMTDMKLMAMLKRLGVEPRRAYQGCQLRMSVNQSCLADAEIVLLWDTEEYDTNDAHSTSSNTGRITIPAGFTFVKLWAGVRFATSSTGERRLKFRKGGSTFEGASTLTVPGATLQGDMMIASPGIQCVEGDYFTAEIWQSSGGALNVKSAVRTYFACQLIP